jgi:hypothetical protein
MILPTLPLIPLAILVLSGSTNLPAVEARLYENIEEFALSPASNSSFDFIIVGGEDTPSYYVLTADDLAVNRGDGRVGDRRQALREPLPSSVVA